MFKESLLDKSEKIEFLILKSLYINSGKMKKQDLCKLNNITAPTLSTYIDNIQYKFKDLIQKKYMSILKTKDYIFLSLKDNLVLDNLMSYYIQDSLIFKIFIYLLKNIKINTIDICNKLNISLSTLNRKLILCNDILKEFNLVIKYNKIYGSELQIYYFYYSLLWNSSIDSKTINFIPHIKLIEFLQNSLNITLGIIEKTKLYIWMRILDYRKSISKSKSHSEFKNNINKVKNNKIFILLNNFFKKLFIGTNYSIKDISYITFCFFYSAYILPKEVFTTLNISEDFLPYKINHLVLSEFKKLYDVDELTLVNSYTITNFVFKITLFKGNFYSVDKLTLQYYLDKSKSNLRDTFSKYLFDKILEENTYLNINFNYFKFSIILILKYINNFSNKAINTKFCIKIGILLRNNLLLVYGLINELNNKLREKFDIIIDVYDEKKSYDLVITNVYSHYLSDNYKNLCYLTDLGIDYDFKNIIDILNKIESSCKMFK